jgi:hypothetical protein
MHPTSQSRMRIRDRWIVGSLAALSVVCATPGVHLAELWLRPHPAVWVSHGLALAGLAVTGWQWRVRRARRRAIDAQAV